MCKISALLFAKTVSFKFSVQSFPISPFSLNTTDPAELYLGRCGVTSEVFVKLFVLSAKLTGKYTSSYDLCLRIFTSSKYETNIKRCTVRDKTKRITHTTKFCIHLKKVTIAIINKIFEYKVSSDLYISIFLESDK